MKPVIVDTSVWVEWANERDPQTREEMRGRVLLMPAVVATELLSGARDRRADRLIRELIDSFDRHRRLIVPQKEDYLMAGNALADLGWPASKKSNDALIVACARRLGAEVITKDHSDFEPLAKIFAVSLRKSA